jgi:hypothetical protein
MESGDKRKLKWHKARKGFMNVITSDRAEGVAHGDELR